MTLARVTAHVVSTEKHLHYTGQKIMVVQPVGPDGKPQGRSMLDVDGVQAGIGDLVLVVDEGGSARTVIGGRDGDDDTGGHMRGHGPCGRR
jgi:microcompartment protein CcmK/EutM